MSRSPDQLVQDFLKGQNLEQIGRAEDAISIYEQIIAENFDAAGPYDRLIWIYQSRGQHREVIRVAEASIERVRTYSEKLEWYRRQISEARDSIGTTPEPRER